MKVDGYVRVSMVGGREGESYGSPPEQLQTIKRWAEQNGAMLGVVETDENVSGGKAPDARRLERLIKRCEDGQSDGVITYHWDRFSREKPLKSMTTVARLEDAGAFLVGVIDGYDCRRTGSDDWGTFGRAKAAHDYRQRVKTEFSRAKRRAVAVRSRAAAA